MKPLWSVLPLNRTEVIRIIFKSDTEISGVGF